MRDTPNVRFLIGNRTLRMVPLSDCFWPIRAVPAERPSSTHNGRRVQTSRHVRVAGDVHRTLAGYQPVTRNVDVLGGHGHVAGSERLRGLAAVVDQGLRHQGRV